VPLGRDRARPAKKKRKAKAEIVFSPSSMLSGADENWQRSFREGRQWARIVKTSLPNHGGREQRQSPPLLRGYKLIRRGKGAPQVFSPRNTMCRQSLGSRVRTKSPDVIAVSSKAHVRSWSYDLIWLINEFPNLVYSEIIKSKHNINYIMSNLFMSYWKNILNLNTFLWI